jgi:LysM repeat protein
VTLGEDLIEYALLATGAVVDGEIAGAYKVMASAPREPWPGERAKAPARASVSTDSGEPENRDPAKESAAHRKRAATVPREDAASEPSTAAISMTSNSDVPSSTSKTVVHSASVSESRVMKEAVTWVEVSPRARDEPHEARSDHSETRTTTDYQLPVKIHVVASGDSLWSISRQYKMTIDQLRSINELSDKHVIQPGQSLYVESGNDKM